MYKMLYILIFSTLLFSCSDSENLDSTNSRKQDPKAKESENLDSTNLRQDPIRLDIVQIGLKKGMTIEEIRALGFGTLGGGLRDDYFGVVNPKMPKNANFVSFIISPQNGLLYVSFSWDERTNSFDTLKRKYIEIRDILIRTYGKEGFGMGSKPGMWVFDMAEQSAVAEYPSERELWRKSDFDADNKWQLENLRLELSKKIAKRLQLEYHFQGYWQYRHPK